VLLPVVAATGKIGPRCVLFPRGKLRKINIRSGNKAPLPAIWLLMGNFVDNRAQRFGELIEPLLNDAYTLARFLARDPIAAEDIVQEASLRAFRHVESLRGPGEARPWLLKIVRNCFYAWREKVGQVEDPEHVTEAADEAQLDLDPQHILERTVQRDAVRAMIEDLPVQFREALVLRELNDLSYREIADLTSMPIGTVMSRLARARDLLRKMWLERGGEGYDARVVRGALI
jgi:RNA polymerase sigma-70 factor (ECF subfamily)